MHELTLNKQENAIAAKSIEGNEMMHDQIDIDNETMLDVLQLFGNYDLAFVLSEEIERLSRKGNIPLLSESFKESDSFLHFPLFYYILVISSIYRNNYKVH